MADNKELKELAQQLRHPSGEAGLKIAAMMHETNNNMTLHSVNHLGISDKDKVLELGHGNCEHLRQLAAVNGTIVYYGLERSALMYNEAKSINKDLIEQKQAFFYLYDGQEFPFPTAYFDKIFTVNTIYFWDNPQQVLAELYRVLKPNGSLNITFAQKEFMKQLPFTPYGFTLYDNEKISRLISASQFKIIAFENQTEKIKNKTGELVNRIFTTVIIEKG